MKKLKYLHQISPSAAPSPSPSTYYDNTVVSPSPYYAATTANINQSSNAPSSSKLPIDFSPTLIAMVVIVAAAFLVVTYLRLISHRVITPSLQSIRHWRHRRRRRFIMASPSSINTDINNNNNHFVSFPSSPSFDGNSLIHGLDESLIKKIPLSIYSKKINKNNKNNSAFLSKFSQNYYCNNDNNFFDCAVCLLEFEESDYIRTLPVCRHAFHVDCIDIWLRSHANCPLCRGGIFRHDVVEEQHRYSSSSPLPSQMLSPARFSLLMSARIRRDEDGILDEVMREEITAAIDDDDENNNRPVLLKRSYSFGFERNFPSERLMERGMMTSPCRYHYRGKRPSPFKSRVFSFRMKSPFVRRRSFLPFSESSSRYSVTGNSRRTKSITSPMFGTGLFSSSRMRCGDPEALLSPERFNRR